MDIRFHESRRLALRIVGLFATSRTTPSLSLCRRICRRKIRRQSEIVLTRRVVKNRSIRRASPLVSTQVCFVGSEPYWNPAGLSSGNFGFELHPKIPPFTSFFSRIRLGRIRLKNESMAQQVCSKKHNHPPDKPVVLKTRRSS